MSQDFPNPDAIQGVVNEAATEATYRPEEINLDQEISLFVDVPVEGKEGETERQQWVYNFAELRPVQYLIARNILLYEHEILAHPLASHMRNIESGFYELEYEALPYLLVRKTGEGAYDNWTRKRKPEQLKAVQSAIENMTGEHADKIRIIKKNFSIKMSIPSDERTQQFKNLATTITTILSLYLANEKDITNTLKKSSGTLTSEKIGH